VREKPSLDSGIISRVKRGEIVLSNETLNDWHHITLPDGKTGWAYKDLFVQN
jgi:uncharacterized protein YgiM (DUF1202 family)